MRFAETEIYSIELEGTSALAKVWRRSDIDSTRGAELAARMVDELSRLAGDGKIRSLVFDVSTAPSVAGPKTTEKLGALLATCERAGVAVEILVTNDAMQNLQFKRLVSEHAPKHARIRVVPRA